MEQKNEQSVYEVKTKYAGEVIAEMAGEIFTTRNFIEAFVDKHEIIYVELLFAAYIIAKFICTDCKIQMCIFS